MMRELVVISGKGGTGKTSITASLAALFEKTVIVDCDVDAADLHLLLQPEIRKQERFVSGVEPLIDQKICIKCGQCREVCVFDAISEEFEIQSVHCEGCGVCARFCPENAIQLNDRECGEWYLSKTRFGSMLHARLGIAEENSGKLVTLLKKEARNLAEKENDELILVDGSPGIGCPVISSLTGADLVLIVTEPTISGVHDFIRVLDLIDHFKLSAGVIVNKADLNPEKTKEICQVAENRQHEILGQIVYDPVFTQAMIQGKTLIEYDQGQIKKSIEKIHRKIIQKFEDDNAQTQENALDQQ